MGFFKYIAERRFNTAPNGERVILYGSFRTRLYVIPNAETEYRLFRKQLWFVRIVLGGIIFGLPLLFMLCRQEQLFDRLLSGWRFLIYLVVVNIVTELIQRLVLANDVRKLKPLETPPEWKEWKGTLAQNASRHSEGQLILLISGSLLVVVTGIGLSISSNFSSVPIIVSVVFFGWCTIGWYGALSVKRRQAVSTPPTKSARP